MGIFSRKLDYSKGSGVLPAVSIDTYSDLSLPSTSRIRVPNLSLMEREKDQGNLEKAFGAAAREFTSDVNENASREVIEKFLGALKSRMAPQLGDEATQLLGRFIGVGFGMAKVEEKSGLMVAGKCHPSILNVIFRVTINLGPEEKSLFRGVSVYQQLIEIAIEVGYVATRLNNSVSVDEMLASVKAN